MKGKHLPQNHTLVLENVLKHSPVVLYPYSSLPEAVLVLECLPRAALLSITAQARLHFPFLGKVRTCKPSTPPV